MYIYIYIYIHICIGSTRKKYKNYLHVQVAGRSDAATCVKLLVVIEIVVAAALVVLVVIVVKLDVPVLPY